MRTTLDLPESLLNEALKVTHCKTKTDVIKFALENIVQQTKVLGLKKFQGKVNLNINLSQLRKR